MCECDNNATTNDDRFPCLASAIVKPGFNLHETWNRTDIKETKEIQHSLPISQNIHI